MNKLEETNFGVRKKFSNKLQSVYFKYLDVNNHPDTCSAFRPFYSVSVSLLSLEPPA